MGPLIPTTGRYQPEEIKEEEVVADDEEDSDGTSRASIFSKSDEEIVKPNIAEKRRKN